MQVVHSGNNETIQFARLRANANGVLLELDLMHGATVAAGSARDAYISLPEPVAGLGVRHVIARSLDGRRRDTSDRFAAVSLVAEDAAESLVLGGLSFPLTLTNKNADYLFFRDPAELAGEYLMAHGAERPEQAVVVPGLLVDIRGPADLIEWAAARAIPGGVFFQVHSRGTKYISRASANGESSSREESLSCTLAGEGGLRTVLSLHPRTEFTRKSFTGQRLWNVVDAGYAEALLLHEDGLPAELIWESSAPFAPARVSLPQNA